MFVDRHFPLTDVALEDLVGKTEERSKLEKLLGIDQTTFGELRSGLVISPFVVSALAAIIPAKF